MKLPFYLWGAGARALGLHLPKIDKIRCTECRRWTRTPAFFGPALEPEALERALCEKCHRPRVEKAIAWVEA